MLGHTHDINFVCAKRQCNNHLFFIAIQLARCSFEFYFHSDSIVILVKKSKVYELKSQIEYSDTGKWWNVNWDFWKNSFIHIATIRYGTTYVWFEKHTNYANKKRLKRRLAEIRHAIMRSLIFFDLHNYQTV